MEYTKPALSITDQLAALQQRGLTIQDTAQAEQFLNNVSYFRFAAYLKALLAKYPTVDAAAMGFPPGWAGEPLWR